jgi:ribosome-associated toxin RatA of RatAB toxin-antitoxin module
MRRITRSAIVECSARQMYDLVEDIESYPEFLQWCSGAHVRERTAGRTVATLDVGMPPMRQSFTTENTNVPGKSIDLRLLHGPFRRFDAHWKFTPLGSGAKVEFSVAYELADPFLVLSLEPMFEGMAGTMVDAFTRRAERLYGRHPR